MDKLKAFFAKDSTKIVAAGIIVVVAGFLNIMPESPTKQMLMYAWTNFVLPFAAALGIASGGTSGLRSNASQAATAQLVEKGVIQPKT